MKNLLYLCCSLAFLNCTPHTDKSTTSHQGICASFWYDVPPPISGEPRRLRLAGYETMDTIYGKNIIRRTWHRVGYIHHTDTIPSPSMPLQYPFEILWTRKDSTIIKELINYSYIFTDKSILNSPEFNNDIIYRRVKKFEIFKDKPTLIYYLSYIHNKKRLQEEQENFPTIPTWTSLDLANQWYFFYDITVNKQKVKYYFCTEITYLHYPDDTTVKAKIDWKVTQAGLLPEGIVKIAYPDILDGECETRQNTGKFPFSRKYDLDGLCKYIGNSEDNIFINGKISDLRIDIYFCSYAEFKKFIYPSADSAHPCIPFLLPNGETIELDW